MKIKVKTDVIRSAFQKVTPFFEESRATLMSKTVLLNVDISKPKTVQILYNNLVQGVQTEFVADEIEGVGKICVGLEMLKGVIEKARSNDVTILLDEKGNTVTVMDGRSNSHLGVFSSDDFMILQTLPKETKGFTIDGKKFKNLIDKVAFVALDDMESNFTLTGVLLTIKDGNVELAATDRDRLVVGFCKDAGLDKSLECKVIIPKNTLLRLSKIISGDVRIAVTDQLITFDLDNFYMVSRLIPGSFVNYSEIIPKEYNIKLKAAKSELIACIEVLKTFNNLMIMEIDKDDLVLKSRQVSYGHSIQYCKLTEQDNPKKEKLEVMINGALLESLVGSSSNLEVTIRYISPIKPLVIEESDRISMFMPIKIQ